MYKLTFFLLLMLLLPAISFGADLAVSTTALAFGDITLTAEPRLAVVISITGSGDTTITGTSTETCNLDFTFSGNTTWSVTNDDPDTIFVDFVPSSLGLTSCTLTIDNDVNAIDNDVTIGGTGINYATNSTPSNMDPMGISVDPGDNFVYVIDKNNHQINKYTYGMSYQSTLLSKSRSPGGVFYPQSILVFHADSMLVLDRGQKTVQKFLTAGTYIENWGGFGGKFSKPGRMNNALGLSQGGDNWIFLADTYNHRVQGVRNTDASGKGIALDKTVDIEPLVLDTPTDVFATSTAGEGQTFKLYILDSGENTGVPRIYVLTYLNETFWFNKSDMVVFGEYGTGNGQMREPSGIVARSDGFIYVSDTGNDRILRFDEFGNFRGKSGTEGSGNNQFNAPSGIGMASDGYIFIGDPGNDRIQRLRF